MPELTKDACLFCGRVPASPHTSKFDRYMGRVFCGPECERSQVGFDLCEPLSTVSDVAKLKKWSRQLIAMLEGARLARIVSDRNADDAVPNLADIGKQIGQEWSAEMRDDVMPVLKWLRNQVREA
jgi:hypothetical protein